MPRPDRHVIYLCINLVELARSIEKGGNLWGNQLKTQLAKITDENLKESGSPRCLNRGVDVVPRVESGTELPFARDEQPTWTEDAANILKHRRVVGCLLKWSEKNVRVIIIDTYSHADKARVNEIDSIVIQPRTLVNILQLVLDIREGMDRRYRHCSDDNELMDSNQFGRL
jgi:hypothetical protein